MAASKVRIGINGFGRIGRIFFRAAFGQVEIVGINDLAGTKTSAHLLKYDSTHGIFNRSVEAATDTELKVDGKIIPVSAERDPAKIPWGKWGVDIVVDCTGAFNDKREELIKHIAGGAKRVIASAPAKAADLTVVYGINHSAYDPKSHVIVSNASCTTNCLAPVAKVLNDTFGIEQGLMTTVHAFTNDQQVLDAGHKDLRRARTASASMIPTTTGAAKAVTQVLPELKGRLDGTSVRVPTQNVSLIDLTFLSRKDLTVDAINDALIAASRGQLAGVLACEAEPLVSVDYNGNPHSSIVDLPSTMVSGARLGKVFSWYDNEYGFSCRMVDLAKLMAEKGI